MNDHQRSLFKNYEKPYQVINIDEQNDSIISNNSVNHARTLKSRSINKA